MNYFSVLINLLTLWSKTKLNHGMGRNQSLKLTSSNSSFSLLNYLSRIIHLNKWKVSNLHSIAQSQSDSSKQCFNRSLVEKEISLFEIDVHHLTLIYKNFINFQNNFFMYTFPIVHSYETPVNHSIKFSMKKRYTTNSPMRNLPYKVAELQHLEKRNL